MKNARRILGVALAVMMIISTFAAAVSAATFSDVEENASYSDAITTLNAFGIIKGYEDGTFKPNQNVTRAEFTAMLMRTLNRDGIGNTSSANLPFSDVSDQNSDISWAIPNIDTAYGAGYINGYEDGTFRPSANVAYEEAVKMIVCALGYGANISVDTDPWYANFMSQAAQIGITQNASALGAAGTPATRACIAQLLYDSMDIDLVENNEITNNSILTEYWRCEKNIGVISANGITSLDSPDINLRDNEIQIYAKEPDTNDYYTYTYRTNDNSLKNYLGYQVEYYYVENRADVRDLKVAVVKNTTPLTINSKDIDYDTTSATQLRYFKSEKDRTSTAVSLDKDNVVIYNGKLYGSNRNDSAFDLSMIPEVGNITLIDSNKDNKYDVLNITDYEIYYVSSKTSSEYAIVDNLTKPTTENKVLRLDETDASANLSIVNKNGDAVKYSSIVIGNLVCYAESNADNGGTVYKQAVVLSDVVNGMVTGRENGESVTIGGKEYKYSNAAPWVKYGSESPLSEPDTQDNYTFVLDMNGEIVAYDKNSAEVQSQDMYGYIEGYSMGTKDDPFSDKIEIRMLTSTGKTMYYGVYKNTEIDGDVYSTASEVVDKLTETALNSNSESENLSIQQLVKYTTKVTKNEGTVLDTIFTAENISSGQKITSDALYMFDKISADEAVKYSSTGRRLTAADGTKVNIEKATIFLVPTDRRDYESYKKGVLGTNFKNGGSYNVEIYDMSTANSAKIVVMYDANASTEIDETSPVYVMTDMRNLPNDDEGIEMTKIKGYSSSASQPKGEFDEWLSPESVSDAFDLPEGSIFRAGTDKDGYAKIIDEEDILYNPDEGADGLFIQEDVRGNVDYYDADFLAIVGSVIAVDDDMIVVAPKVLGEGDSFGEQYPDDVYNFNINDFSGARSLKYDTTGRDIVINDVSPDYKSVIDGLSVYSDGELDPSDVLIYMYNGKVKLFCVL